MDWTDCDWQQRFLQSQVRLLLLLWRRSGKAERTRGEWERVSIDDNGDDGSY